ncbi:AhpC/TSA family protein [Zymoseptoria brevis]|uniref:AhpC/TSA family protein n=1 Tax=Zymoseptoria brevis TaxID=1047168 RepID=A0A0F4GBB1_9PEZI|nr:AhpC/TSA family protein [Zymoseptoria brevis]
MFRLMSSRSRQISQHLTKPTNFHSSARKMVQVGDAVPSIDLFEAKPGAKVDLSKELASGKGVIVGVPAAFSPGCSNHHIPGYINSKKLADAGKVFVISVNDPFVMGAWAESLDADKKSGIRFLADPHAEFNKKLDTLFDSAAVFGQDRSKRYALVTEDGKVKSVHIEPDNTGVNESAAEKVFA